MTAREPRDEVQITVGYRGLPGQPDRLEQAGADLHQRARRFFLELASREPERYLVLPAREPRDRIAAQVQQRVGELLSSAAGRIAT